MAMDSAQCELCETTDQSPVVDLFGYAVCLPCKKNLGLFHDKTIRRHALSFEKRRPKDPRQPSYEAEIEHRLDFIEKDFTKKKIKLLHIQDRLSRLKW